LARLGPIGSEVPVVVTGDATYDLRSLSADIDHDFFESGGVEATRQHLAAGRLATFDVGATTRFGPPIARPGSVVCVGMNYEAHARESGSTPPSSPALFLKPPNTVVGPQEDVTIPPGSGKVDWEVELGVVIGSRASYLDSPEDSIGHIAGFVMANDLSEREHQLEISGGQWSKGKSAPGFCPTGPWLVTPEDLDHRNLRLRSWVNGDVRQDSSTADMLFDIEYLVWYISQYMALEPGDLILTGTPDGVALSGQFPYVKEGDVVTMEIEGLGRQGQQYFSSGAKR